MQQQENIFEPLPLRRRELAPVSPSRYRVTGLSGECRQIDAPTAYEAFIESGFAGSVKIERVSNLRRGILEKKEFADEMAFNLQAAFSDVTPVAPESPEALLRHKNPILSASQLSMLMKALQQQDAPQAEPQPEQPQALASPPVQAPVAAEALPAAPLPEEPVPEEPVATPAPTSAMLAEGVVPGPAGLDVHGDGFDEIIPSGPPEKPQTAVKSTADSLPPTASHDPLPPARELTEAEVEKLLGGT